MRKKKATCRLTGATIEVAARDYRFFKPRLLALRHDGTEAEKVEEVAGYVVDLQLSELGKLIDPCVGGRLSLHAARFYRSVRQALVAQARVS